MEPTEKPGPSILTRAIAVLIVAVAAWILLKVIIGVLSAVAWVVAIAVAVVGVLWALSVLRR
jgi:hypothetical protein